MLDALLFILLVAFMTATNMFFYARGKREGFARGKAEGEKLERELHLVPLLCLVQQLEHDKKDLELREWAREPGLYHLC